jgi:hypothetical protein
LKDFKLSTQDFIVFNNGRFLDDYEIDKILGEGIIDFLQFIYIYLIICIGAFG